MVRANVRAVECYRRSSRMSWCTVIWSMAAGAGLTLAGLHLLVWCRQREAWGSLLFSLSALGTAAMAACDLGLMHATSPAEYGVITRWIHVPIWLVIISLVGFVRFYLRAGRPWLAWTVCVVRTLSLIANFMATLNLNYREITALRHIPFLGEPVAVAVGARNPWMLLGQLALLLLVVFVADATIEVWRRGERGRAVRVGGSMLLFIVLGTVQTALVVSGIIQMPFTLSLFFLGVVVAMDYELSEELLRATELAHDLRASLSAQKQAEADARERRNELNHLSRVALVGEMATSLAHELNQPLTAIITNAAAAQRSLGRGEVDLVELRETLTDIADDGRRAGEVIKGIKGMVRKVDGERHALDLNEVIASVLRLVRADALAHGCTLVTEPEPSLPAVAGDNIQLQQVLLNLVINSFDAMRQEVCDPCRVEITSRRSGEMVEVSVRDFGPGLPPDAPDRVFERFYSTKGEGMGMGLAIAKSLIEAHNGTLHAENVEGGGARFWFRLPIQAVEANAT